MEKELEPENDFAEVYAERHELGDKAIYRDLRARAVDIRSAGCTWIAQCSSAQRRIVGVLCLLPRSWR
ncbi:MAG: hypothetical protein ACLQJR_21335 [Stellaceae bacterium]